MHTPLRLSVFIEAKEGAIERVIEEQPVVRALVENSWVHLLRIDPITAMLSARRGGRWQGVAV